MKRQLIATMYLWDKKAYSGFDKKECISQNPLELAKFYSDHSADGLILFDLSDGDKEHEEALDCIKAICELVEIPVYGAGNIHRMEDVKKLLYAGCQKAILNFGKEGNIEITQEVSSKFGKDKIVACVDTITCLQEQADLMDNYCSEVLYFDGAALDLALQISPVPVYGKINSSSLGTLIAILKQDNIIGVLGDMINENAKEYDSMKKLLEENGIPTAGFGAAVSFDEFKKNSDGMVPVVVQDYKTDQVLMVAYMNKEAYEKTIHTGIMTYWSRSRDELWIKGATSGHYQYVKSLTADCDMDTILARVSQVGAACHTGNYSCFFQEILKKDETVNHNPLKVFEDVFAVIQDRKVHPKEGSYTNYLFDKGIDKILKKCGEEATEIVIAAKNPDAEELKYEISDFLYHMMVLMAECGVDWDDIVKELANRK